MSRGPRRNSISKFFNSFAKSLVSLSGDEDDGLKRIRPPSGDNNRTINTSGQKRYLFQAQIKVDDPLATQLRDSLHSPQEFAGLLVGWLNSLNDLSNAQREGEIIMTELGRNYPQGTLLFGLEFCLKLWLPENFMCQIRGAGTSQDPYYYVPFNNLITLSTANILSYGYVSNVEKIVNPTNGNEVSLQNAHVLPAFFAPTLTVIPTTQRAGAVVTVQEIYDQAKQCIQDYIEISSATDRTGRWQPLLRGHVYISPQLSPQPERSISTTTNSPPLRSSTSTGSNNSSGNSGSANLVQNVGGSPSANYQLDKVTEDYRKSFKNREIWFKEIDPEGTYKFQSYAEAYEQLKIEKDDTHKCPISLTVPNIPVYLHGQLFDLKQLMLLPVKDGKRTDPLNNLPFTLQAIQPAFRVKEEIENAIKKAIQEKIEAKKTEEASSQSHQNTGMRWK